MAVDTTELDQIYSKFLTEALNGLKDLQSETQMEDEERLVKF